MIGAIAQMVANGLRVAASLVERYTSKESTDARIESKINENIDELHEALEKRDINTVRRLLS